MVLLLPTDVEKGVTGVGRESIRPLMHRYVIANRRRKKKKIGEGKVKTVNFFFSTDEIHGLTRTEKNASITSPFVQDICHQLVLLHVLVHVFLLV